METDGCNDSLCQLIARLWLEHHGFLFGFGLWFARWRCVRARTRIVSDIARLCFEGCTGVAHEINPRPEHLAIVRKVILPLLLKLGFEPNLQLPHRLEPGFIVVFGPDAARELFKLWICCGRRLAKQRGDAMLELNEADFSLSSLALQVGNRSVYAQVQLIAYAQPVPDELFAKSLAPTNLLVLVVHG